MVTVIEKIAKTVFGDPNDRVLKKHREVVEEINAQEPILEALSDEQLAAKTDEFKQRLAEGETLDDLLVEAYAVVREAARRTLGMRHFDVQMIGGIVLHQGQIAEMRTGEGKTLVATLPIYLNALAGKGVHLVTPNDYLSKVGLQLMGPVYHFLGLTASVIQSQGTNPQMASFVFDPDHHSEDDRYERLRPVTRPEAYAADITYGTNNEFGFDYLRDNMVRDPRQMAQRGHYFGIIDEVDNILIDEARTPLIISGKASQPSDLYNYFAKIVKPLGRSSEESVELEEPDGEYVYEAKDRIVYLTEAGVEQVEKQMRRDGMLQDEELYSDEHADMIPYLDNSLRAKVAYIRDKDYVVMDGQIVIVDEFTGRLMHGRRFSEGLHQAIEAKEGVQVREENVTLATITFQNFFRMYDKLAGMTGTAETEKEEFQKIYDLDVTVIPTHRPIQRIDYADKIYKTEAAKFEAIVEDLRERQANGQPVLVGTVAIEASERLGRAMKKAGLKDFEILNAKQHFREASIIAQAGRPGAITIATNMAGRGVDILLGGNPDGLARDMLRKKGLDVTTATREEWQSALSKAKEICARDREKVLEAGGLYVLGTERHDARRIDNQLRGRSGRQGDPGASRFYLSLEDDLMLRFGGERLKGYMNTAGIPEDMPIENNWISNAIKQAQVRVEGHNFDIRKRVLEYDDVVNKQREDLYALRRQVLYAQPDELREMIHERIAEEAHSLAEQYLSGDPADWNLEELHNQTTRFRASSIVAPHTWETMTREDIETDILKAALQVYEAQAQSLAESDVNATMTDIERSIFLQVMDEHWRRHLTDLSILREGIGLEGIRGRNPLVEYQIQGFQMYNAMKEEINSEVARGVYNFELRQKQAQTVRNVQTNSPQQDGNRRGGEDDVRQAGATGPGPSRAARRRSEAQSGKKKVKRAKRVKRT
ncbi:MAG: preprotein translocase subunit SecA [Anaerolineales bacterium]